MSAPFPIEITGVNTWNKGAELMLAAIVDHFRPRPDVRLAVDGRFGGYAERARYGLWFRPSFPRVGRASVGCRLLPGSFRQAAGMVEASVIRAVLDASGFAFGDQHPVDRIERFAGEVEAAARRGRPVILLPQALGPFEAPRQRAAFARIADAAAHIFARDPISLRHAEGAAPRASARISLAPDFTNLLKPGPSASPGAPLPEGTALIVPNHRMLEKAADRTAADRYLPMLAACASAARDAGLSPVVLVHGVDDRRLLDGLFQAFGDRLPVHEPADALAVKAVIGQAAVVIGSRFHALVSALSQAVPAVATSWSHKYEMLFEDYGCPQLVLPVDADADRIRATVATTCSPGARQSLAAALKSAGDRQREAAASMWREVDALLAR